MEPSVAVSSAPVPPSSTSSSHHSYYHPSSRPSSSRSSSSSDTTPPSAAAIDPEVPLSTNTGLPPSTFSPSSSSYHTTTYQHLQHHPTDTATATALLRNVAAAAHARSQTVDFAPSTGNPSTSAGPPPAKPIKRKPLSSTASALAIRFSSSSSTPAGSPVIPSPLDLPKPSQRFTRSFSIDSPTVYDFSSQVQSRSVTQSPDATLASHDAAPSESRSIPDHSPTVTDFSDVLSDYGYEDLISDDKSDSAQDATPETVLDDQDSDQGDAVRLNSIQDESEYEDSDDQNHEEERPLNVTESATDSVHTDDALSSHSDNINPNSTPPMFAPKPTPPHLKLDKVDTSIAPVEPQSDSRSGSPQSATQGVSPRINKPLPKSPSQTSPFAALFSWVAPSPSVTDFSSIPSPVSPSRNGTSNDTPYSTTSNSVLDITKSNAATANAAGYRQSYLSATSPTYTSAAEIEEMEDELKAISAELASSIRREMDLEDLVDRLQEQVNNPQAPGKRTSDYFSDSGYSSAKLSEFDQNREEVERIQRRSEQEKASIRLELTNKLQDERSRRKELDQQIKELAEKASHVDLVQMNSLDASDRVKDLENTCEDLRRRLSEERTVKNNFEDLLTALKGELHEACNERDNLRDEVVPQLRARVEGLETESAEYANLTYESTKMQQELQSLIKENNTLRNTSMSGSSTPINRMSRAMSGGLARSNSVATGSFRNNRPAPLGLSRSNSVKNTHESREALAERLKDVEAQRDALHSALKSLLERQEFQNRENEKKIQVLQTERERLLTASPKRGGFQKEISSLRTEINVLRRRAEDALEEKWQVEKGLAGLKMDLDRAEEEITLLRDLLKEKDILIPPSFARSSGSSTSSGYSATSGTPVTSESLQRAYKDLQAAYNESLERIKKLELETPSDEKTQLALQRLERSLSTAVTERDAARQEVNSLRSQYDEASSNEGKTLESERALADELSESARRVEELANQVRQQLQTNAELRERLSSTVTRGENDRKANSDRIADLQVRLKTMEDQLIAAQTESEERVARHEEEIATLREAHNEQLRRMDTSPGLGGMRSPASLKSPRKTQLLSPLSPMFPRSPRSPRVSPAKTFEDATQMKVLRDRVAELEKALEDAEKEMQDVVARMSTAQIEVLNLQEEREVAVRETRKLQKILEQEQVKSFEERFKSLNGRV